MELDLDLMKKSSSVEFPVTDIIEQRKSRRAYSSQPIEQEKISSIFEAARWAPSSMNEQPWVYVYATQDQPALYKKIWKSLNESNQVWARHAPVLVVSLIRKTLLQNGRVNGAAHYDAGAANALLSLQATHLGLNVHQIGGYSKEILIHELNVPDDYEPMVVIAIGYPGDPESLPEHLKQREQAKRERYTQDFFVHNEAF